MFYVAICDDEKYICSKIKSILEPYVTRKLISIDVFYSGEELYDEITKGVHFDLIFLDIELRMMNGVMVGSKIRDELSNEKVHIVFISAKPEYALELFAIRPLHFLVKPLNKDQIVNVLEKAMELSEIHYKCFQFQIEQTYYKIFYGDILYFESNARKIILHTVNEKYTFYEKLDHIEEVTYGSFLRIHRSYLVNPIFVEHYEYEQVTLLEGERLPISKSFRKIVRSKLLEKWR